MPQDKQIQGNDTLQQMVKTGRTEQPVDASFSDSLPLETYTLQRDSSVPVQFRGRLIGAYEPNEDGQVGTKVMIFVTQKGKFITHIFQWQRKDHHQGEGPAPIKRSRKTVGVHVTGQEALDWLIQDGGGTLGGASLKAWDMACEQWPPLQGRAVEIID